MATPKISVLLCTVRPGNAYVNHPEWHVLQKVIDDLERQTFLDFELVVVDGLAGQRDQAWKLTANIPITHIPPTPSFWTEHRKVAICRYRNTGIAHCRGELIVNLDDCCELPPYYLEMFWHAWKNHGTCLSPLWHESGDSRPKGDVQGVPQVRHQLHADLYEVRPNPPVFGFGSYPREVALWLNGYNEWFDGSQALEDFDWSTRLLKRGVKMHLAPVPGFKIHAQSPHDPRVIDPDEPLVKCCNQSWWAARVKRGVNIANHTWPEGVCEELVGPCFLLDGGRCRHHMGQHPCGYLETGFADERHELAWTGVQAERKGFRLEDLR